MYRFICFLLGTSFSNNPHFLFLTTFLTKNDKSNKKTHTKDNENGFLYPCCSRASNSTASQKEASKNLFRFAYLILILVRKYKFEKLLA